MNKESNAEIRLKEIYPDPSVYEKERLRIIESERNMVKYMKIQIRLDETMLHKDILTLDYCKNRLKELHPRRKAK